MQKAFPVHSKAEWRRKKRKRRLLQSVPRKRKITLYILSLYIIVLNLYTDMAGSVKTATMRPNTKISFQLYRYLFMLVLPSLKSRVSRPEVFFKEAVIKFHSINNKILAMEFFSNKVAILLKETPSHVIFCEFHKIFCNNSKRLFQIVPAGNTFILSSP